MYDISFWQLALIAVAALLTAVVGGVAGYGTGALMPLILVPIVGAEPVVPIIALAALFSNASRAIVFRRSIVWPRALVVLLVIARRPGRADGRTPDPATPRPGPA